MRRRVEDAGASWCAGRFGIWCRLSGATSGTTTVGGRELVWRVAGGRVVVVTHADASGTPASYSVEIVAAPTPHGGARPWWQCPGCGRRCGMLYLFGDRDRLACRACCGVGFASQYPRVREAGAEGERAGVHPHDDDYALRKRSLAPRIGTGANIPTRRTHLGDDRG